MNDSIFKFIHWTWNLPGSLLGFIIYNKCKKRKIMEYNYKLGTKILVVDYFKYEAYSSEPYIIIGLNKGHPINSEYFTALLQHELGHTCQQFILGWLAVPILELGTIWAVMKSWGWFKNIDYYAFPTESWASKLGKVKKGVL